MEVVRLSFGVHSRTVWEWMALFLDFCRVQPVSKSTCRSMSAIIFLWILELFPWMVCNNLRELTVAETRPDGTDIVALVHKCQKYAQNFDVCSWWAPSFQPCTAYEFMHPSTTQWPYSAPARSPCKTMMAVVVVDHDNVFARRYYNYYLWLGRNRLCTHGKCPPCHELFPRTHQTHTLFTLQWSMPHVKVY